MFHLHLHHTHLPVSSQRHGLSLRTNSEHGGLGLWLALEELVSGEL